MPIWNFTTTIRNPNRIQPFSTILKDFTEKEWSPTSGNQRNFQYKVIQNKLYLEDVTANEEQVSFERAREIAESRNWANGPDHRGRMSLSPLSKLGLCFVDDKKILHMTVLGEKLSNNEIKLNEYFENVLLKFQLPLHDKDKSYKKEKGYEIIPLLGTLQLINNVNEKLRQSGKKPVGISKLEFDIFIPTLIHYNQIDSQVDHLLQFRSEYRSVKSIKEKKKIINKFKKFFVTGDVLTEWDTDNERVTTFKKTLHDYGDNIRRYFRLADWISLRGNGYYIDLNPRKKIENESILQMSCKPLPFPNDETYSQYLADPTQPTLPWKDDKQLIKKYTFISDTISEISNNNNIQSSHTTLSIQDLSLLSKQELESQIKIVTQELHLIDKLNQEKELINPKKIDEVIELLQNLGRDGSAALELEHQTTRGLMALNDGTIAPNYPIGDDGEPLFTAPGGVGDIECFYKKFNLLCEVTMLTNNKQWMNEGVPVSRHYREFSEKRNFSETYCLFIAPALNIDTAEIFFIENNKRSEHKRTQIIPFTISQFIEILELLSNLKQNDSQIKFSHEKLLKLYQEIISSSTSSEDEEKWLNSIQPSLDSWKKDILVNS